jgi:hypothetical protein
MPPILVDEDERIIDPTVFDSLGLVQVEGKASELYGARTPKEGRVLDYDPPLPEITWVNGAIMVRCAKSSDGRCIPLRLAKPSQPATTQP